MNSTKFEKKLNPCCIYQKSYNEYTDLEEGPRFEESLAQGLVKVEIESVVGVNVVSDPEKISIHPSDLCS